jgi:hypothetical protein
MAAEVFAGFKDCNNCSRCFCRVEGFRVEGLLQLLQRLS